MNEEKKTTINERTRFIVDHFCDGNLSRFARETDIKQTTAFTVINKENHEPKSNFIDKVVRRYPINAYWYITGEGSYEKEAQSETSVVKDIQSLRATLNTLTRRIDLLEKKVQ